MPLCDFNNEARTCLTCGCVGFRGLVRRCEPVPVANLKSECPHFLGATQPAETVLVFGCAACPNKQGIAKTVCECDLDAHPRCVLFGGGTHLSDATVQRCVTCKDNPKLSPPLPNPIAERQNQPDDERHD